MSKSRINSTFAKLLEGKAEQDLPSKANQEEHQPRAGGPCLVPWGAVAGNQAQEKGLRPPDF